MDVADQTRGGPRPRAGPWQFGLATLLLLILFSAALLAAVRSRIVEASLPLSDSLTLDYASLLHVLAGFVCCVAGAGIAICERRPTEESWRYRGLRSKCGGAVGGLAFALGTRAMVGVESFEPSWVPFSLHLVWWPICGWFAGAATQGLVGWRGNGRPWQTCVAAALNHEENPAKQLAADDSPVMLKSRKWKSRPAWVASLFLHVVALWLLTIGFFCVRHTVPGAGISLYLENSQSPLDDLSFSFVRPFDPPDTKQSGSAPSKPASVALRSENFSNAEALFGRQEKLPILGENDGRFAFNIYSSDALDLLNVLCARPAKKPTKDAQVAVSITNLTTIPRVGSSLHLLIKATNTGKTHLANLFICADCGNDTALQGFVLGGGAFTIATRDYKPFRGGSWSTGLAGSDSGRSRVIYHVGGLDPGGWVQFQVVVQPKRAAEYSIRSAVISELGVTAQSTTKLAVGGPE